MKFLKIVKDIWKIKKSFSKFDKILLILREKCKAVMKNKNCYCILEKFKEISNILLKFIEIFRKFLRKFKEN